RCGQRRQPSNRCSTGRRSANHLFLWFDHFIGSLTGPCHPRQPPPLIGFVRKWRSLAVYKPNRSYNQYVAHPDPQFSEPNFPQYYEHAATQYQPVIPITLVVTESPTDYWSLITDGLQPRTPHHFSSCNLFATSSALARLLKALILK